MNPKPWLATYRENGIAESVNADAYPSVVHMLDEAMQRYADQPAFRAFGQTLSFADVDRQSAAFAAWLQQRLGVKKGDRIAVMLPNLLAFPIACIGILRAGAVQVNVNPLYTPRELEHQLKDSGSETIVIFNGSTPTLAEVAAQAGIKTVITVAPGDGTGAALPSAAGRRAAGGQHRVRRCVARGRVDDAHAGGAERRRPDLPAVHRRHHRPVQGRGAVAPQPGGQRRAVQGHHAVGGAPRAGGDRHRDSAVPHLRADGEFPDLLLGRRRQLAGGQPARHGRFRRDAQASRSPRCSWASTRCTPAW
jgi:hypothetical protein